VLIGRFSKSQAHQQYFSLIAKRGWGMSGGNDSKQKSPIILPFAAASEQIVNHIELWLISL